MRNPRLFLRRAVEEAEHTVASRIDPRRDRYPRRRGIGRDRGAEDPRDATLADASERRHDSRADDGIERSERPAVDAEDGDLARR